MKHNAAAKLSNDFGLPTTVDGVLTTDHAASSFGKPVFVPNWTGWTGGFVGPMPEVLGAEDVDQIMLTVDIDAMFDDSADVIARSAASAGFRVVNRIL